MKDRLIRAVRAYNRFLSEEYLKKQGLMFLLRHLHPLDREDFAKLLLTNNSISKQEYRSLFSSPSKILDIWKLKI